MAKTGIHNRITPERYNEIKADLKTMKDECKVMKKHGVGQTTIRLIGKTNDFYEYRANSSTGRKERKRLERALSDFEINGHDFSECDSMSDAQATFRTIALILAVLLVSVIALLVIGSLILRGGRQ